MDQLLRKCQGLDEIQVFTYDGDTPKEKREGVYSNPRTYGALPYMLL